MALKSVTSHAFSMIPDAKIQRSSFDRSFGYKTTFDADYLIPIFVDEALPGDTFNLKMTAFARLATPLFPIMDNMVLSSFFFSIPYRLVWDNFTKFMGEQDDPGDSCDYTIPVFDIAHAPLNTTGYVEGSTADYMGLPTKVLEITHSCLPFRAMNRVWNEWFRDQNIQDSLPYGGVTNRDDGPDDPADYPLQKRGKRHDYFTSCLPWAQKSDGYAAYSSGVTLPLGTSADLVGNADVKYGSAILGTSYANKWYVAKSGASVDEHGYGDTDGAYTGVMDANSQSNLHANLATTGCYADLSTASAASINSIRLAFQLQHLLERDARGGTRYVEQVRSHFNVVTPSAGWRTEYLGGGKSYVNIHPIANTTGVKAASSPTAADKFQGDLSAMGTVSGSGGFVKSFTEHCIVLGFICVTADLTYQNSLNRMWKRSTRWDFYFPELAHIGEQVVTNDEIYCQGSAGGADDAGAFGYQERFAEYRYKPSQVTGLFRSNATGTLDAWHLSQEFADLPVLTDPDFIESNTPLDRCIAVPAQPHFILDSYFNFNCVRPMPVYSVPGLMDHF